MHTAGQPCLMGPSLDVLHPHHEVVPLLVEHGGAHEGGAQLRPSAVPHLHAGVGALVPAGGVGVQLHGQEHVTLGRVKGRETGESRGRGGATRQLKICNMKKLQNQKNKKSKCRDCRKNARICTF